MKREFVKIGNVHMGCMEDDIVDDRPLLIYVHGGPLYPETFLISKYFPQIEKHFQCVFPEMRGCGLSGKVAVPPIGTVVDTCVSDVIALTTFYLQKFQKEKAYILGHSFGSVVASLAAKQRPELYHAYIGVGQVNDMMAHNAAVYDFIHAFATSKHDTKLLKKIEGKRNADFFMSQEFFMLRSSIIQAEGKGMFHTKNYGNFAVIKDVFAFQHYTLSEKFRFFGTLFSTDIVSIISEELLPTNFAEKIQKLEMPMYIFNGKEDLMTVASQAELFYNSVEACKKKFYCYENSAHFPMIDEPKRFAQDLQEIISQVGASN